jgi:hypothetical protein
VYLFSADEAAGVLVGIYTSEGQTDADYARAIEAMARADRAAHQRSIPYAHIMVVESDAGQPSAKWRQRFAEHNRSLRTSSYYFAFVTSSMLVRGIFTAIRWLTGARDGHRAQAFANLPEACAWLRATSGRDYPELEALYTRARGTGPHSPRARPTPG